MTSPACYEPLLGDRITVMADAGAAWQHVQDNPESVDAVVEFKGPASTHYRIRMNHTDVPATKNVLQRFVVHPLE